MCRSSPGSRSWRWDLEVLRSLRARLSAACPASLSVRSWCSSTAERALASARLACWRRASWLSRLGLHGTGDGPALLHGLRAHYSHEDIHCCSCSIQGIATGHSCVAWAVLFACSAACSTYSLTVSNLTLLCQGNGTACQAPAARENDMQPCAHQSCYVLAAWHAACRLQQLTSPGYPDSPHRP